ncbi:MAG: alanine--tRNA ligase [Cytophagales bacterium]|nr:alanine--tRNA ligase [Cytophagales bacterium]MDW8384656.1 alanine--tRNA ligase [Flammeovirgaceae bacterium]
MTSTEIRKAFLDFFASKQHQIVPSAPIVVKNDPTLMFTNAGMNQFKDFFLGNKVPTYKRIADTQKCLRVSGKHNDLEEVGIDTYHHTMFEMLGNWSFGDYFKKEAIAWAWELLTEVYRLPIERLYVTVFEGDAQEGLEPDSEAYEFWKEHISPDRILFGGKKDNFWEMGNTGPCGPCTEIHIDLRPQSEVEIIPGKQLVNASNPQVIEIWNLVFIQFNRNASGILEPLPDKHVDTGMGFERLVRAIQGKNSNYDTDIFLPLIQFISSRTGIAYGTSEKTDIATRVLADHIRAVTFAIADGQLPSNSGAGYVIRRILRRAVRYGYTFLNRKEPFLYQLVEVVATQFADVFPEAKAQQAFIEKVIQEEESAFLRTLENGLRILDNVIKADRGSKIISGDTVFELFDTFGFPVDLTQLIAREHGFEIDQKGFEKAMELQKERSRSAAASEKGDWIIVHEGINTDFIGYDYTESVSKILRYRQVEEKKKKLYQIVFDKTPFYAESGGQVGDTGYFEVHGEKIQVLDTQKENDLIVHLVEKLPNHLQAEVKCQVDVNRRRMIMANHTATHLLQGALRQVLGNHVQQKGSLVSPDLLRFDFSHYAKLTDEEIRKVEALVNQKIRENILLDEKRNVPIEEAKKMGAMALFGEKYGDFVRVITFDESFSRELCGGTHVPSTGHIGLFKIISESSVAAGVRRIEALTALKAEEYVVQNELLLKELSAILKEPKDLCKSVRQLVEEKIKLEKEIQHLQLKEISQLKETLLTEIKVVRDINFISKKVNVPNTDLLRQLAFDLKHKVSNLFCVLAAEIEEKPHIAVMISENLVKEKGLDASKIVRELAKVIKGGGGGQPFFATAGGKDVNGLQQVIELSESLLS